MLETHDAEKAEELISSPLTPVYLSLKIQLNWRFQKISVSWPFFATSHQNNEKKPKP